MGQYACTTQGGTAVASPDTCNVPTGTGADVPTSFTNTGQLSSATNTESTILIANMNVITSSSEIQNSSGDESGTNGGVSSGTTQGKVAFKSSSSKVLMSGKGCVYLTCTTAQNGSSANAYGSVASPGQTTVLVGS